MAADHPRRASAAPGLSSSSAIPPAPPLPPQKHTDPSQRYTSAFARFVAQPFSGYSSRPPSAQAHRPEGERVNSLIPRNPGPNSLSSQDASHKTGLEITALDINHERTHAILAGREILKTIRVTGTKCTEESNLRAAILNYNNAAHSSSGSGARSRDTLEIHDVKWSHGQFSSHIATAATNGKVIIYDLNRTGVELARLHEHHRQVHKVAFNPHQGYLLLSGSQDDTVRLWDLRDLRKDVMSFTSRDRFLGMSGPVRDLRWSPTDGVEFAFGTDSGVIHRWNYRINRGPLLKINAHDKTCTAIDWHPDGKHLVSASKDKTVKVWDFSSDQRRQKPAYVIRTPYPVYNARWRPPCWQSDGHDHGLWKCTMLATSYDRDHPTVHLWNFQRPFLPFREISRYSTAPTDMLWQHRDLLWTVGREGVFNQTDVQYAPKVIDRRNMQALAVSPTGDVCGFVQKRYRRARSSRDYTTDDGYPRDDRNNSPQKESFSRSSADDSVDDTFLSSSFKRHHGRSASNRSARSLGSSQPSSDSAKVMALDEGVDIDKYSAKPGQVALRGTVPGTVNVPIFTYLAQKYKTIPLPDSPTIESFNEVRKVFDQNAEYAQRAAFYRLAETWKMIGFSTKLAIQRRAEEHRRRRLRPRSELPAERSLAPDVVASREEQAAPAHPAIRAIIAENGNQVKSESSSNAATPLARPQLNSIPVAGRHHELLPDPDHAERLALPASVVSSDTSRHDQLGQHDDKRFSLLRPGFDSPGWYSSSPDFNERRATMNGWRAQPRALLTLETPGAPAANERIPPSLDRQSSDESFMFSASTDPASMGGSFASRSSHPRSMVALQESWEQDDNHTTGSGSEGNLLTRPKEITLPESVASYGNAGKIGIPRSMSENPIGRHPPSAAPSSFSMKEVSVHEPGDITAADGLQQASGSASSPTKIVQKMETLRKNNQLIRPSSSESNIHLNSKGSFSETSPQSTENKGASGTTVPDKPVVDSIPTRQLAPPAKLRHETESAPPALQTLTSADIENERLILSDFLALDANTETEKSTPFTVVDMLSQLLDFHTTTLSDAQTPAHLLLLLLPLLPPSPSNQPDADATTTILASYADHLTTTGMSPAQVSTVLTAHLHRLILTGINPLQAESILSAYHAQLSSLGLHNSAAYLRRLTYPAFPAVYDQATKDTQLGLLCRSCKNALNNPADGMRCETCRTRQAECPVCWSRYPPFGGWAGKKKDKAKTKGKSTSLGPHSHSDSHCNKLEPSAEQHDDTSVKPVQPSPSPHPTLYTTCPLCSHTAHAACLSTWFGDPVVSEGACPTPGCLCDCVNGIRRQERLKLMAARKAEKERLRGPVARGDEWRVGESRAVGAARGALGGVGGGGAGGGGPGGPGKGGEERRVRVVEPGRG